MSLRTFLSLLVGLGTSACAEVETKTNLDHCTFNEGDRYCAEMFPDRPYCTQGQNECSSEERYGCVAEVTPECHVPCGEPGDMSCVEGESSTGTSGTGTETSESSESSGSESSTTAPMPCVSDEECTDAAAPFCGVTGECGTCSSTTDPDAACAGVDPMAPLCVGGACVACTPENPLVCDEQLLLCDGGTNACVPCVAHDECGSGACELAVGTCFPEDVVVSVDDAGAVPMPDFASVSAAVASIGDGGHGVIVVHERDGGISYQEATLIDGDKRIALLAAPGEAPIIQGTAGNPGISVQGAGTILYMEGLEVSLSAMNAVGLRVNDAFTWVDRSRIVQNSGGGVLAENGAELTLRNCFVGGNIEANVLELQGATAEVLYTTLGAGLGVTTSLACDALSMVTVRNSLIVSRSDDDEVLCANLEATNTAAELLLDGAENIALGPMDIAWFLGFNAGDFGLTAMHPVAIDTAAQWQAGDPLTDIDGDPRPAIDGTPDYAGADIP